MQSWGLVTSDKLDRSMLMQLFNNQIAGIVVPSYLSQDLLKSVVAGIQANGLDYYEGVDPAIGRIGITQFEHRHDEAGRAGYFASVQEADLRRSQLFPDGSDLLYRVLDTLAEAWDRSVSIARECDGRPYFAGLVRVIGETLLHCDWAQLDAPGWSIGDVRAQISWNIYCLMPDYGGDTVVYHRQWVPETEQAHIPDSYGYDPRLIDKCQSVRIKPRQGQLVLFNSRNFHRVESSSGSTERITISSFVGLKCGGELVLWS